TLVAPAFVYGGLDVTVAMFVAFAIALGLNLSTLRMLVIGWVVVMVIRHLVM
ncbi:MAG: AzlD family protein, partial [Ensifer adhaerens]|nr:AzlD family protein [Ensifer adhaerens]